MRIRTAMKKYIIALLIIFSAVQLNAQTFNEFSVGGYTGFKAGINGGKIQAGRMNAVAFNGIPDIGASAFVYISEQSDLGLSVDLGYSAYAFTIKDAIYDGEYTEKFGYITFGPNIHFYNFAFGLHLGFPIHADFGDDIDTEDISILIDLRLRAEYPLIVDDESVFSVFANVGYMMTGVFVDYSKQDPLRELIPERPYEPTTESFNPRAFSLCIGVRWMFPLDIGL